MFFGTYLRVDFTYVKYEFSTNINILLMYQLLICLSLLTSQNHSNTSKNLLNYCSQMIDDLHLKTNRFKDLNSKHS